MLGFALRGQIRVCLIDRLIYMAGVYRVTPTKVICRCTACDAPDEGVVVPIATRSSALPSIDPETLPSPRPVSLTLRPTLPCSLPGPATVLLSSAFLKSSSRLRSEDCVSAGPVVAVTAAGAPPAAAALVARVASAFSIPCVVGCCCAEAG